MHTVAARVVTLRHESVGGAASFPEVDRGSRQHPVHRLVPLRTCNTRMRKPPVKTQRQSVSETWQRSAMMFSFAEKLLQLDMSNWETDGSAPPE